MQTQTPQFDVLIKFVTVKGILQKYLKEDILDKEEIEYILKVVDYILNGTLKLDEVVLDTLCEQVLVASTYHKSTALLDVYSVLQSVGGIL